MQFTHFFLFSLLQLQLQLIHQLTLWFECICVQRFCRVKKQRLSSSSVSSLSFLNIFITLLCRFILLLSHSNANWAASTPLVELLFIHISCIPEMVRGDINCHSTFSLWLIFILVVVVLRSEDVIPAQLDSWETCEPWAERKIRETRTRSRREKSLTPKGKWRITMRTENFSQVKFSWQKKATSRVYWNANNIIQKWHERA